MTSNLISLAIGLLVGGIYGLLDVRSPAPPVLALTGLLDMLIGEQAISAAGRWLSGAPAMAAGPQAPGADDR